MGTEDRATIADLEIYGLPIRIINALENHLGLVWLDDLLAFSDDELRSTKGLGPYAVRVVREALRNLAEDSPVRTIEDCTNI